MTEDVKNLVDSRPPRHPTTYWKKRQRRRPPNSPCMRNRPQSHTSSSQSQSQIDPEIPEIQSQSNQDAPPNQEAPQFQHQERQPRARTHRRQRRFRDAAKFQRWYRANKKRCIRNILGEDQAPQCDIPPTELEQFFTQPQPNLPTSRPPEGLPQQASTTDPDDLTQHFSPEEVETQMKRLQHNHHLVLMVSHITSGSMQKQARPLCLPFIPPA